MSTDAQTLRAQADRAAAQAREAEEAARRQEEKLAAMKPQWRVAEILHRHWQISYPGAGGAMDGGDPWYYEIPTGHNADARWREEWERPGDEHRFFLRLAEETAREFYGQLTDDGQVADEAFEGLEKFLLYVADKLRNRTAVSVRIRRERWADSSIQHAHDEAVKAIDKVRDEALGRPRST